MKRIKILLLSLMLFAAIVPSVGCDEYWDGLVVSVDVFPRPGFYYFGGFFDRDDDDFEDFWDDIEDEWDDFEDDWDDLFDD